MDRPKVEGTQFLGPPVDAFGIIEKPELRVGNAESLVVMTEEYAFFTPAILYLHAGFTDAPLIDAVWEMREDIPLFHRKFQQPIFRGLQASNGDEDWNYVLWAVQLPYWKYMHDFIASLTLAHADTQSLIRVGAQEFQIPDPLAIERAGYLLPTTPLLTIRSFGINGNKFRAGLVPGLRPFDPLILRFFPPEEDIRVFAEAYYKGQNPINARLNYLNAKKAKETTSEGET